VAGQEYHYRFHAVIACRLPKSVLRLSVLSLRFPHKKASWRTRRLLGMKTESFPCSMLPTVILWTFFFKEPKSSVCEKDAPQGFGGINVNQFDCDFKGFYLKLA
jgi:hypothetical protein